MTVPDYTEYLRPVLELMADGRTRFLTEIADLLVPVLGLTDEDVALAVSWSNLSEHRHRTNYALSLLKRSGLLNRPARGTYCITEEGKKLAGSREALSVSRLEKSARERAGLAVTDTIMGEQVVAPQPIDPAPEEMISRGYSQHRAAVEIDLLDRIKNAPPAFFEQVVIDLLVAMGYGGNRTEAGRRVGRTGDNGIDGVISEDRLGIDVLYIQAKRYQGSVGVPWSVISLAAWSYMGRIAVCSLRLDTSPKKR